MKRFPGFACAVVALPLFLALTGSATAGAHPAAGTARAALPPEQVCDPRLELRSLAGKIRSGRPFSVRLLVPRANEDHAMVEQYADHIGDDPFLNELFPDHDKYIRPPFLVNPIVLCASGVDYLAARDAWGKLNVVAVDESTRFLNLDTHRYTALLSHSPDPRAVARVVVRRAYLDPYSSRFGLTDTDHANRIYGSYVS